MSKAVKPKGVAPKSKKKAAPPKKILNLALQGGGAHGAFAWGVLDRLLEDGHLEFEGITATSAGALNACAMAYGLHQGGPDKARETLHDFWHKVHTIGERFNPMQRLPWDKFMNWNNDYSTSYFLFEGMTRILSPYQFNPFDLNPLQDALNEIIDFAALRTCTRTKLFINCTNVRTGKVRVFNTKEINDKVAMASACLPFLYKAVEIGGEHYWDGGYMGNPSLFPLFYKTAARDILIVHINPVERAELPTNAPDIMNRINEITFNGPLLSEMRAIVFVKKLLDADMLRPEHRSEFKNVLLHAIRADRAMRDYSVASKFDSDWAFLTALRDQGRAAAARWLGNHRDDIGVRDTVDVKHDFLYSINPG